jgi:hypothetical protein
MFDFRKAFVDACNIPSDINEHLPLFNILAKSCDHITEFGVRWGTSSTAWLNNSVVLRAYDIKAFPEAVELFSEAEKANKDAKLIISSTLDLTSIEPTDLLFIDSRHTYDQCKKELRFAPLVKKYLVFHDTVTFGTVGEDGEVGLLPAIHEFLENNQEWTIMEVRNNCNGLMILTRRNIL